MWRDRFRDAENALNELINKSLVKEKVDRLRRRVLWMHDQLRGLGGISFILRVMRKGKENVEMIRLDSYAMGRRTLIGKDLMGLKTLRYLECSEIDSSGGIGVIFFLV
ncbi:hypothetical protein SAY86_009628 [Trapa natans]|uniref:Uncharacterized protein n=1 Tax=Trapa natans TaxID=22666 RepID=A0AAN7QT04_TRANT|nr:hypothetical protein SAY86_009628 [Trapa natans]